MSAATTTGPVALGLALKYARRQAGVTQHELGHQVGLSRGFVCAVEAGRNMLLPPRRLSAERALGLPAGGLEALAEDGDLIASAVQRPPGPEEYTIDAAAAALGVDRLTVWRMATCWHGQPGSGRQFPPLTAVDLKAARAWLEIGTRPSGPGKKRVPGRRLMAGAERAIRADPDASWLLIVGGEAHTFADHAAAAAAWLESGVPVARLIGLDGRGR